MLFKLVLDTIETYSDANLEGVTPKTTLESLNIDSLSMAEMLFAMEDKIGKELPEPNVRPTTVQDLMDIIEPFYGRQ
jgi:acyl carrier protein